MTLETYGLYLAAVAVFFATPPDTSQLLIISNSLRHGLHRSLATVYGDLSANALQMTAAAFGLATVIAASAEAFMWIKWIGVAYLAWIGLRLFFAEAQEFDASKEPAAIGGKLFRQGFVTSSTNPYAVMFFAALFPQFIDPSQPILPQLLILGGTYLLVDGVILVLWGVLARRAFDRVQGLSVGWINRVCGTLMVCAAVLLATKDLEPQKQ